MESLTNIAFWASIAGLFLIALLGFGKSRNFGRFTLWTALLAACGAIYFFLFQTGPHLSGKGEQPNQLGFLIVLYVCMLVGMAFNYLFTLFLKPKENREAFDLGAFLVPMLASPLVFIPLLGAFQNAPVDLTNLTLPKYMIFFVAFQNGFFWKEVVDNLRKRQAEQKL